MWYVLCMKTADDEKTRNMVNTHVDHSLFTRCIVFYRRKREIHRGISMFIEKLLFPSYVFGETDRIKYFAKRLQWYPGKMSSYRQVISSSQSIKKRNISSRICSRAMTLSISPTDSGMAVG